MTKKSFYLFLLLLISNFVSFFGFMFVCTVAFIFLNMIIQTTRFLLYKNKYLSFKKSFLTFILLMFIWTLTVLFIFGILCWISVSNSNIFKKYDLIFKYNMVPLTFLLFLINFAFFNKNNILQFQILDKFSFSSNKKSVVNEQQEFSLIFSATILYIQKITST
ncbi:hypothetical protein CXP39_01210 [Mesoplasma syrphidae]|uniref:Transmembrane protein n=1 Tax=Mesoplasma syrphidae TaxID=225999 RepID=A0A2K9BN04_9MOLU|nr:hypothetical protein CXP39_01210 [Mesoplasma syrphidae]